MSRSHYQQQPQVVALGRRGLSLLIDEIPVFLAFQDHPPLANASAEALRRVLRPSVDWLHWPEIGFKVAIQDLLAKKDEGPGELAFDASPD